MTKAWNLLAGFSVTSRVIRSFMLVACDSSQREKAPLFNNFNRSDYRGLHGLMRSWSMRKNTFLTTSAGRITEAYMILSSAKTSSICLPFVDDVNKCFLISNI